MTLEAEPPAQKQGIYRVVETTTTVYYLNADSKADAAKKYPQEKHNETTSEDVVIERVAHNPWTGETDDDA